MARFSFRRMNAKQMDIFRATGTTINLILRSTQPNTTYAGPGHLLDADTEPDEATDTTTVNIFGQFDETDSYSVGELGRERIVKGIVTVPMLYKSLLAQAEYINPYNDGKSRFKKLGAIVDEGRMYAKVTLESVSLANRADI